MIVLPHFMLCLNTTFISILWTLLFGRSQNSPKHFKSKLGLPHEYKPNIHELKQLFDDSKRSNGGLSSHNSGYRAFPDAKPPIIDTDLTGLNLRQRNALNFEKAKQKFDNASRRATGKSVSSNDGSKNYPPSSIPKRTYPDQVETDGAFQSITSPFEDKLTRSSFSMTSSINLDGLKVSDDE